MIPTIVLSKAFMTSRKGNSFGKLGINDTNNCAKLGI